MINECAIYDFVDVTGLAYNLHTPAEHEKDGKKSECLKRNVKR